jgi:hypothetical protein
MIQGLRRQISFGQVLENLVQSAIKISRTHCDQNRLRPSLLDPLEIDGPRFEIKGLERHQTEL